MRHTALTLRRAQGPGSPAGHKALLFGLLSATACAHATQAPPIPAAPPPMAAVPTTPDAAFRAQQPTALAHEPAFTSPVPSQHKLKSGATLLVVENHAVPIVAIDLQIKAGIDDEPLDRDGLVDFLSQMLMEGTTTRSSIELEIARERLAAQLGTGADESEITVHLNALKETLPDALALMADVLLHPAFRDTDIERVRGLILTGLEQKKGSARALASDDFSRLVWGAKNARGQPSGGTPASVKAIQAADLKRFHKTWFVPNNALISVSGDTTADEVSGLLDAAFAKWKPGKLPARKKRIYPAASARGIVLTDIPTASQSQVWVGWRGPKATDPEALPLQVGNNVLGGLFTSRLNRNLREDKAYSYGVKSRVGFTDDSGTVVAAGGIIAQHTAEALVEYEKELNRIRGGDITDEELARAKQAIIRGLPSLLETDDAVAGAMAGLVALGRPLDYYAKLPARVAAVTKPEVMKAINDYVTPDRWQIVVVGPASNKAALEKLGLGKVEIWR
jgi:zinc protease